MEEGEQGSNNEEKLAGYIFMCNRMTKPECYRFRVFGLPLGRKQVLEKINPGTFLFLFDTDVKFLYGIYRATSSGKLRIEPFAFGGKFPAQVKFNIYKDCLPLRETQFRHAIHDNYLKGSNKFNPELDIRQVRSLLALFRPLPVSLTAPTHPVLKTVYPPSTSPHPPMNDVHSQISRPSFSEDVYFPRMSPNQDPWKWNYKHVYEVDQPTGHAYTVHSEMPNASQAQRNHLHPPASTHTMKGTYAPGMGSSYYQPCSDPQYSQYPNIVVNPQPEFHAAAVNTGGSYAQSLQNPHAYHNLRHPQPEFHVAPVNPGSNYVQPLPDTQHTHQSTPSVQPNLSSSLVNVDHGNSMIQLHASSSVYCPYVTQEVVSASYQGYGATQGGMNFGNI